MAEPRPRIEPVVIGEHSDVAPEYGSFADFYAANRRSVLAALALTLRDRELARDAAAEGMARAYQHWAKVGTCRNPSGWAYRAGLNWATSRLRKFRRERPSAPAAEPAARCEDPANPELEAALANLPMDQRAVVVLRYHLDWSEAATAESLGIAPGTVKSRLNRALAVLRSNLRES